MFSKQRVFCFRVIEIEARKNGLPAGGSVAGITGFLEFTLVWVKVAVRASGKLHVAIACGAAGRIGLVALFAGNFYVQTGEGIARFCMVKILRVFPVLDIVAFGALIAELTFMWIFVTGEAVGRKTEIGFSQIMVLD